METPYVGKPPYDPPYSPPYNPPYAPYLNAVPYLPNRPNIKYPPARPPPFYLPPNEMFGKSQNSVRGKRFFRVFAAAKEPFGKTELPLGEFVDSSTPIFEISDRISNKEILKQNRIGGLQNPLRAPKNIIDEDPFLGIFGFNQNKYRKTKRNNKGFDLF